MSNVKLVDWRTLNHDGIEQAIDNGSVHTYLDRSCTIEGDGIQIVSATGRAKCRLTGERIAKGEKCIKGLYDFVGAGSYTCGTIYMSLDTYLEKRHKWLMLNVMIKDQSITVERRRELIDMQRAI